MDQHMDQQQRVQLHFDSLSKKALLCFNGKDYVLPDTYVDKEEAAAEAKKFAWEELGLKQRGLRQASDVEIWLR